MKGCDDPNGFDRGACGRCTSCKHDYALIRQYETPHVATQIATIPSSTLASTSIEYILGQEVLDEILETIYEELIFKSTSQINPKYIDIDAIKGDLKPVAEKYLSEIKLRFDTSRLVIDEVTKKLARDLVDQILVPEKEYANDQEAEEFMHLTPQLLEMMRN